jgi:hypothetical protein
MLSEATRVLDGDGLICCGCWRSARMLEREQMDDCRGGSGFVVTTFEDAMPGFPGLFFTTHSLCVSLFLRFSWVARSGRRK